MSADKITASIGLLRGVMKEACEATVKNPKLSDETKARDLALHALSGVALDLLETFLVDVHRIADASVVMALTPRADGEAAQILADTAAEGLKKAAIQQTLKDLMR
jgi:hypothetical protein